MRVHTWKLEGPVFLEDVFILKVGVSLWRREQFDNFGRPVSSPPGGF